MNYIEFKNKVAEIIRINQIVDSDGHEVYYCAPYKNAYYHTDNDENKTALNAIGWLGALHSESGQSGGNCWNNDSHGFSRSQEPFPFIEKILEGICPNISFLNFRKLSEVVKSGEYTVREYYGNYTDYSFSWVNLKELFNKLVEMGQIEESGKCAVIIGGLPLSGKTTLAANAYPDFFLIDDPTDFDKDVAPYLDEKKIVITDPHLCFKKNREKLVDILENRGYDIQEIVLDIYKETLKKRAKAAGKTNRLEFIDKFEIEH